MAMKTHDVKLNGQLQRYQDLGLPDDSQQWGFSDSDLPPAVRELATSVDESISQVIWVVQWSDQNVENARWVVSGIFGGTLYFA